MTTDLRDLHESIVLEQGNDFPKGRRLHGPTSFSRPNYKLLYNFC